MNIMPATTAHAQSGISHRRNGNHRLDIQIRMEGLSIGLEALTILGPGNRVDKECLEHGSSVAVKISGNLVESVFDMARVGHTASMETRAEMPPVIIAMFHECPQAAINMIFREVTNDLYKDDVRPSPHKYHKRLFRHLMSTLHQLAMSQGPTHETARSEPKTEQYSPELLVNREQFQRSQAWMFERRPVPPRQD